MTLNHIQRRRLSWGMRHFWSRIRLHRRVGLATAIGGAILGVVASDMAPRVYESKAVVDSGIVGCVHGFALTDACRWCVEARLPLFVRSLRTLDRTVMELGLGNPDLEGRFNYLRDERQRAAEEYRQPKQGDFPY